MDSHVVIVGNPVDGIRIYGPFETFNDAHNWADGTDEYWITELEAIDD